MSKIINNFLLAGDKFMPELHLKQPGFTYSAFTKNKERIEIFMQSGNRDFIYKNELHKPVSRIIWLMVNQNIFQKDLNQTNF